MQHVQRLTSNGGCAKYVCKHIEKIYKQNDVIIEVEGEGRMATRATILHNTKVTSSNMGKYKERKNKKKGIRTVCYSLGEVECYS